MTFSSGNIVRHKKTGQIYEISKVFATHALARVVLKDNTTDIKEVPIFLSDCELVLDQTNDAFNVLFGESDDES